MDDKAQRLAAAEARKQRILARGQDRLDFVTGRIQDPTVLKEDLVTEPEEPAAPVMSPTEIAAAALAPTPTPTPTSTTTTTPIVAEPVNDVSQRTNLAGPRLPTRRPNQPSSSDAPLASLNNDTGTSFPPSPLGSNADLAAMMKNPLFAMMLNNGGGGGGGAGGMGGLFGPGGMGGAMGGMGGGGPPPATSTTPVPLEQLDRALSATSFLRIILPMLTGGVVFLLTTLESHTASLLAFSSSSSNATTNDSSTPPIPTPTPPQLPPVFDHPLVLLFRSRALPLLHTTGLATHLIASPARALLGMYLFFLLAAYLGVKLRIVRSKGGVASNLPWMINLFPAAAGAARMGLVGFRLLGSMLDVMAIYLVIVGLLMGVGRDDLKRLV